MDDKACHCYASISDLATLWRRLNAPEMERAQQLIQVTSAELRQHAKSVGKDLDELAKDEDYAQVLTSVVCDVVARVLMTSTEQEPMTQMSQTAGPYTVSGTYLVPGGGLFIKKSELARLGLRRQNWGRLMSMLKGISVRLHVRYKSGTDAFNRPMYDKTLVTVDNVLVFPAGSDDKVSGSNMTGMSESYTLCIPRGDTHEWLNTSVEFWGETWDTVGRPQAYIEDLLPLEWNRKVQVRRHE